MLRIPVHVMHSESVFSRGSASGRLRDFKRHGSFPDEHNGVIGRSLFSKKVQKPCEIHAIHTHRISLEPISLGLCVCGVGMHLAYPNGSLVWKTRYFPPQKSHSSGFGWGGVRDGYSASTYCHSLSLSFVFSLSFSLSSSLSIPASTLPYTLLPTSHSDDTSGTLFFHCPRSFSSVFLILSLWRPISGRVICL